MKSKACVNQQKAKGGNSKQIANLAFSIDTFCHAHGISRPTLYKAWSEGYGPGFMRVGRRVLIPVEAATEWRQRMTARSNAVPLHG